MDDTQKRINAILKEAGWPDATARIFHGTVRIEDSRFRGDILVLPLRPVPHQYPAGQALVAGSYLRAFTRSDNVTR